MQQTSLIFDRFIWIDYRTTKQSVSPSGKKNPIWMLECYWIIKKWVVQPAPALTTSIATWITWKLFKVRNILYLMTTSWLQKLNSWETAFDVVKTQAFANYPESWNIFEFKYKWTETISWTVAADSAESYIKSSTTLWRNVYAWTLIEIFNWATSKWVYYVTSNDANTIYIEWNLDYIPLASDTFKIFIPTDYLYVYDWQSIYILDWNNSYTTIQTINIWLWRIQKNNNRLMSIIGKKISLSTINHGWYFPYLNYVYTTWNIYDSIVFWNSLYLFCDDWTWALSWTWYTTLGLDKISQYIADTRVYPIINDGRLFIIDKWRLYPFETTTWLEYNYRLNPDTHARIFSIPQWIVFNLWHWLNKQWILNIEETKNEQSISIWNFIDWTLQDIIYFNSKLFAIIWTTVYKENWFQDIAITFNTIDFWKLTYIYYWELEYMDTKPSTIQYDVWSWFVSTTLTENWWYDRYPILKWSEMLTAKITATNPISKFILIIWR